MSWKDSDQPRVAELLRNIIEQKRLAHAYIFYGRKGTGRKEMALELAKAINCERQSIDACDECPTCLQIQHRNHPDVMTIRPDGSVIKIAQLRELQAKFKFTPPKDFTRVVILEKADQMRDEAANSLLKFLEEPSSPMVAILITESLPDILPTIQSRCHKIHFPELPPEVKADRWRQRQIPEEMVNILAHLPYEVHIDQLELDTFQNLCTLVTKWGTQILSGNHAATLTITEEWMQNEIENDRTEMLLDILLLWFRDLLLARAGKQNQVFNQPECKDLANKYASSQLMLAMDNVLIARRLLVKQQLNRQAILEQMVLAIQENRLSMENDWKLIPI